MKTPMAWAAERFDRHHAIGADRNGIESGRTPTRPAGAQPPAPAVRPGIVSRIPIDAVLRQVDGVVVVGTSPHTRPYRSLPVIAAGVLKMEATTAHEGDGFAQGGRHGSKELFIGMERHRHTPSP